MAGMRSQRQSCAASESPHDALCPEPLAPVPLHAACPGVCATGACGVSCAGALQSVLTPLANTFSSQVPNLRLGNGSDLFGGSRSFFNLVASGAAEQACSAIPFPTYTASMISAGLVRWAELSKARGSNRGT